MAPGAYDGLSARLVEQTGFPAIYASGGAIARSAGVPDLGLLSASAIADRFAAMADVVGVPIELRPEKTIELALQLHPDARRVVVITGDGERFFAAGADVTEFATLGGERIGLGGRI